MLFGHPSQARVRKEKQLAAEKKKLKKVEQMENRIGQARLYILSPNVCFAAAMQARSIHP